jgi:hypothetical protein
MVGLKWLGTDRKAAKRVCPVLFEMKYGDDAISGGSDIKKHLDDASRLLKDPKQFEALCSMAVDQFNQLSELGLLTYNKSDYIEKGLPRLQADCRPEVVFVLANHNPRSKRLMTVLDDKDLCKAVQNATHFDLRFYVSAFAGYAMHDASMVDFDKFKEIVRKLTPGTAA